MTRFTESGGKYPATDAKSLSYFRYQRPADVTPNKVSTVVVESMSFVHLYTAAAIGCITYSSEADNRACATLAHLCVLATYDRKSTVRRRFVLL